MPRKEQGWITFQSSEEERQILEQICQQTQRTKTEVLREMLRNLARSPVSDLAEENPDEENSDDAASTTPEAALPIPKISARNVFQAKVKNIVKDLVNAEITLAIAPGIELVSVITSVSADRLELVKGKKVFAVIKSSSVMIAERSGNKV